MSYGFPPGGELEYGESMISALEREMLEETNLVVKVGDFAFAYEYIQDPFHAVELFFLVDSWEGELKTGFDPEHTEELIQESSFVSFDQIAIMDRRVLHGIFDFFGISCGYINNQRGFQTGKS